MLAIHTSLRRLYPARQPRSTRESGVIVGQRGRRLWRTIVFLTIVFLLGISLYFPLILGYGDAMESRLKGGALYDEINSPGVDYFTLGAAAFLFPIVMEGITDVIFLGGDEVMLERVFFVISNFLTFLAQFIFLFTPHAVSLFGCSLIVHVWLLGSVSVMMEVRFSGVISFWKSLLILAAIYILCFCSVWHFAFDDPLSLLLIYIFRALSFTLILLVTLLFLYQLVVKFRDSGKSIRRWFASTDYSLRVGIIVSTTIFLTYVTFLAVSLSFDISSRSHTLNANYTYLYYILSITSSYAMTFIPQRMLKAETQLILSDLQLKKSFVRFISHELRTPLSIVMTGLDFIAEQVMDDVSKYDILSTVQDIKQPCITGVDILNELLEFEKIESGDLVLCKSSQDPVLFLDAVIAPFTVLVRQKNIEFKVSNELVPNCYKCEIDESKVCCLSNCFRLTISSDCPGHAQLTCQCDQVHSSRWEGVGTYFSRELGSTNRSSGQRDRNICREPSQAIPQDRAVQHPIPAVWREWTRALDQQAHHRHAFRRNRCVLGGGGQRSDVLL